MNLFVRDIYVFLFPFFFFGCPSCFWAFISNVRTIFLAQCFWAFNSDRMYSCLPFYFYAFVCSFFIMRSICFCPLVISIRLGRILSLNQFLGDLHPFKGSCHLASSVIYIRLGGILSLSQFLGDLHPFKGSCHLASSVIYICLDEILLLSQDLTSGLAYSTLGC